MTTIRKIVCAVDLSDMTAEVAAWARLLAQKLDSELIVLYVAPAFKRYRSFDVENEAIDLVEKSIFSGAEEAMAKCLAEHFAGVRVQGRVAEGYAAEQILAAASADDVDMVVMGTKGRKGMDRVLFGSVAEQVLKSSPVPVFTVRPRE